MNAVKLSVKTYAVEISLPKPGDVFLKVWTKTWQRPNLWCTRRNLCNSKEVLTCLFFTTQTRKITQTQTENTPFPSIFHPKKLHVAFHGVIFLGYSCHNNRSCRGLKNVQNALQFTTKLFYIVSVFLYEFSNGKSTLDNSAFKFADDEQALYQTCKQTVPRLFLQAKFRGDL